MADVGVEKLCHLRIGGDLKKDETSNEVGPWGSIHDKEQRADNWAFGDTTEASMWGGEIIVAFDTKTARGKIGAYGVYKVIMYVCIGEQFQWSDVYSKRTGEDLPGC